jgi:2-keto-4-pentenoate hydratase/2-oxohepta-3-ene-1,7-dioic acid hydratase in catechol pathway
MKIVRFLINKKTGFGVQEGESIRVLQISPFRGFRYSGVDVRLRDVKLLAPTVPTKIVCLGLNYLNHAKESNATPPANPLIFLKPPTAVIGPEDKIIYPEMSKRVDYEGELGVVIGRKTSHVSKESALDYVLGYTCFNDVTARDLQRSDGQWTRAKGFDTFASIGPCIETELDPVNTPVETYLNSKLVQKGNTSDLIFPVREVISFISQVMTLLPGDVIATGTPEGIGPMKVGDKVEVKIPPIGVLRNCVADKS